jgi:hypothetical protein
MSSISLDELRPRLNGLTNNDDKIKIIRLLKKFKRFKRTNKTEVNNIIKEIENKNIVEVEIDSCELPDYSKDIYEKHMKTLNINLSEEEIIDIIKKSIKLCKCGNKFIQNNKRNICHKYVYESYSLLSIKLNEYCLKEHLTSCAFCNRPKSNTLRFHFDHINMFDKKDSICIMMMNKEPIEDIIKEINKCQLLCIDCHSIVTKFEWIYGFIQIKKDINKYGCKIDNIKEIYETKMDTVYNVLKRIMEDIYDN